MNMEYGMWPAAALMIVAASWVLYRYVAPRRWKEWRNAGLVQAFIIALYAEMYGFPLTLYVLTGFLVSTSPSIPALSGRPSSDTASSVPPSK